MGGRGSKARTCVQEKQHNRRWPVVVVVVVAAACLLGLFDCQLERDLQEGAMEYDGQDAIHFLQASPKRHCKCSFQVN